MARIGGFFGYGREGCAVARVTLRLLGCTVSVRVAITNDQAVFVCLTRSCRRVQTDRTPRKTSG